MNNLYKEKFKKLENFLNNNFKVEVLIKESHDDTWLPFLNKIIINKSKNWKIRFYSLLHESGHVVIDKNKKKLNIFTEYKQRIKSKKDFVSLIEEEISAWKEGAILCKEISILIDNFYLQKIIAECITSYVTSGLSSIYGKNINLDYISSRSL